MKYGHSIVFSGICCCASVTLASPAQYSSSPNLQKRVRGTEKVHLKVPYDQKSTQWTVDATFGSNPHVFSLLIDTGSEQLWVAENQELLVPDVPVFTPSESKSFKWQFDGPSASASSIWETDIEYIDDQIMKGELGWDTVTLQSSDNHLKVTHSDAKYDIKQVIQTKKMNVAIVKSISPPEEMKTATTSGFLGLGFIQTPVEEDQPDQLSFFQHVAPTLASPVVTLKLPFEQDGDIRFGYESEEDYIPVDTKKQNGKFHESPIASNEFWRLQLKSIRSENSQLKGEFDIDTGSPWLSLNEEFFNEILSILQEADLKPMVKRYIRSVKPASAHDKELSHDESKPKSPKQNPEKITNSPPRYPAVTQQPPAAAPGQQQNIIPGTQNQNPPDGQAQTIDHVMMIPCQNIQLLSNLRWEFHLGKGPGVELSVPSYVDLKYIVDVYRNKHKGPIQQNGMGYCFTRVEWTTSTDDLILGVPFFNTNWVSLHLDERDLSGAKIRWAPQRY